MEDKAADWLSKRQRMKVSELQHRDSLSPQRFRKFSGCKQCKVLMEYSHHILIEALRASQDRTV
eukprot:4489765-Amphidinium_carterae.3